MSYSFNKISDLARQELPKLLDNVILEDDNGWKVFNEFKLERSGSGFLVKQYLRKIAIFSNKRTALSWCILSKKNRNQDAAKLEHLDSYKLRLLNQIDCLRRQLLEIKDYNLQELVYSKLISEESKLEQTKLELDKCVNLAKYCQLQGFYNETARSST